jgi:hypothetical protein
MSTVEDTYTPPFAAGDLVGWSHQVSTQHSRTSVLRKSAFVSQHRGEDHDDPGTGQIGVVVAEAGRNLFEVQFEAAGDEDSGIRTLTADELVKLEED